MKHLTKTAAVVAIILLATMPASGQQEQWWNLDDLVKKFTQNSNDWLSWAMKVLRATGPLSDMFLVIDPGHGGVDPGARGRFQGKAVYESGYVYDVSLRVKILAEQFGAKVFMTILDGAEPRNLPFQQLFPPNRSAKFAIDKSVVRAGTPGLSKRIRYGNLIAARHKNLKPVWISIHFDRPGNRTDVQGIRVVTPDLDLDLSEALVKSFATDRRSRQDMPVVLNGDKDHGLRNLYVLSRLNRIEQKVLIELGNFNNPIDVYRIRAWNVRQAYATAIVRALIDM
ncbi:MAG TPA: N-acetylmuramoyl-L-alanine amidase [Candidatus Paceibacterota bacterium]